MKNLQNETQFCDIFLACDDQQFKVHGVILSSVSPVLSDKIPQHVQNEDIINRQENCEKSQMFDGNLISDQSWHISLYLL